MKIERTNSNRTSGLSSQGSQDKNSRSVLSGQGTTPENFVNIVEEMENQYLLENLELVGNQLSRFPTMTLLSQYRGLVSQLLDCARRKMHNKKEYKWRRTERSMFVVIEKIEEALIELEEGLRREGERTQMLHLVEEIKGCLISLLF